MVKSAAVTLDPPVTNGQATYTAPRQPVLNLVRIPERLEPFDLPADSQYAGLSVTFWTNPPQNLFLVEAEEHEGEDGWFQTQVIKDWNIAGADGNKLPIAPASMGLLPTDLMALIMAEYWRRRNAPLVAMSAKSAEPTSAASPAPSPGNSASTNAPPASA